MQYQNVIFPNSTRFHCQGCGSCCKDQPPDINYKEQQRIDAAGYINYLQNPADPNNRNLKRKSDGSCIFFTKQNRCQINPIKPAICSLEPFIITDYDHSNHKIFLKLNPLASKECKGISLENTMAYEEIGKAAQTIIKDLHELVAQRTGLLANDRRLGVLVRNIVIN